MKSAKILWGYGAAEMGGGEKVDWDALVALGLPLAPSTPKTIRRGEKVLAKHLRLGAMELSKNAWDLEKGRKVEAFQALLLGLKLHFPSFYARYVASSPIVSQFEPEVLTGRLIKLERIAVARLAEYL